VETLPSSQETNVWPQLAAACVVAACVAAACVAAACVVVAAAAVVADIVVTIVPNANGCMVLPRHVVVDVAVAAVDD